MTNYFIHSQNGNWYRHNAMSLSVEGIIQQETNYLIIVRDYNAYVLPF